MYSHVCIGTIYGKGNNINRLFDLWYLDLSMFHPQIHLEPALPCQSPHHYYYPISSQMFPIYDYNYYLSPSKVNIITCHIWSFHVWVVRGILLLWASYPQRQFIFLSRRLACATRGGRRKLSGPLFSPTFLCFFHPLWGNSCGWISPPPIFWHN